MDSPEPQPGSPTKSGPPNVSILSTLSTPARVKQPYPHTHKMPNDKTSLSTANIRQSQALHNLRTPVLRSEYAEAIEIDLNGNLELVEPDRFIEFLFAFCGAKDHHDQVVVNKAQVEEAFTKVRTLVNEDEKLRGKFDKLSKTAPKGRKSKRRPIKVPEAAMYKPFAEACNYAFAALAKVNCDGLPDLSEDKQIVMVVTDSGSPSQDQEHQAQHYGYKPDICITTVSCMSNLVSPDADNVYRTSKDFKTSPLYWRNILCPIEVKPKAGHQSTRSAYKSPFSPLPCIKLSSNLRRIHDLDYESVSEVAARSRKPALVHSGSQPQHQSSTQNYMTISSGSKRKASQNSRSSLKKPKVDHSAPKSDVAASQDSQGGTDAIMKRDARIQLTGYATHRMSSAFDITHTVGMLLVGYELSISWLDRQGAIQSHLFDIHENLPHFLLLLLILQRFSLGRWGYAGNADKSGLTVETPQGDNPPLIASFATPDKGPFYFQPQNDVIHAATSLVGRGPWVIGGSKNKEDVKVITNSEGNKAHHPYVLKLSWPEVSRKSEVEILDKAAKIGRQESESVFGELIIGHVPIVEAHLDPTFPGSNTGTIRYILVKNYDGSGDRQMRYIVFERLVPLSTLPEPQMVQGYIEIFLCHRALWLKGVYHCDISAGNLMWHPRRKAGILNDFDLSKLDLEVPSGRENTGTLPFVALDLLTTEGLQGRIKRLYRHDAEAFAWSLAYICLNHTLKGNKIVVNANHPLAAWFSDIPTIMYSKCLTPMESWDRMEAPAYPRAKFLAQQLVADYLARFEGQRAAQRGTTDRSVVVFKTQHMKAADLVARQKSATDTASTTSAVTYKERQDSEHFVKDVLAILNWLDSEEKRLLQSSSQSENDTKALECYVATLATLDDVVTLLAPDLDVDLA